MNHECDMDEFRKKLLRTRKYARFVDWHSKPMLWS